MSTTATYALLTRARRSLGRALQATTRRPLLGLDFGALSLKLKGLLAGGTAKFAAATILAGTVAAGGAAAQHMLVDDGVRSRPKAPVTGMQQPVETTSGTATARATQKGISRGASPVESRPAGPDHPVPDVPGAAPGDSAGSPAVTVGSQPSHDASAPAAEAPRPTPEQSTEPESPLDEVVDSLLLPEVELPPVPEVELPPPPVDMPDLPPVEPPEVPPVDLSDPLPVDAPELPPSDPLPSAPPLPQLPDRELPLP